jgi:hypothetical protein
VQVPAAAVLVREPLLDLGCLVRGQVVQHDVHGQAAGDGGVDLLEEPQHVLGGLALLAVRQDLTCRHVHRCEQVGRAVPLVVVGHRSGSAGDHRQAWLGAVHCLALGLLVEAETTARLGGFMYSPTTSTRLVSKFGSLETLNVLTFRGLRLWSAQTLAMVSFPSPNRLASKRVVQCVPPSSGFS